MRLRASRLDLGITAILIMALSFSVGVAYFILSAPPERRVQYVPDDAFYYLTLARNFASHGQWTFDSGTSVTTGFHPLYAYALAALYRAFHPTPERYVRLSVLLSFVLVLPSLLIAGRYSFRARNLISALLLLLFVLSRNVALNSISGVEWSLVVLLSALYCVFFCSHGTSERRAGVWLLFGCGFLGSLARSDFGLLPLAFAGGALAERLAFKDRGSLRPSLIGLGGAALGVLAVSIHDFLIGGEIVQSSARMKLLWLRVYGPSIGPIIRAALSLFGPRGSSAALLVTAALACFTLVLGIRRFFMHAADPRHRIAWVGSVGAIAGYVLLYSLNPAALQNWYSANLVAPLFLVVSLPFEQAGWRRGVLASGTFLLLILVGMQLRSVASYSHTPEWPHQAFMYRAGLELRDPRYARGVGSWNAGIIGFYQGGTVVNIDGLVNNDVFPFARRNALPDYIERVAITRIVDFEIMLSGAEYRIRGGYDRPDFLARLEPERSFGGVSPGSNRLMLYRVLPRGSAQHQDAVPLDTG